VFVNIGQWSVQVSNVFIVPMKLCLMILSVPWYIFNGLEHTAILSNFLTFITGSNSRLLRIPTESIPPVRYPVLVSGE
jgi:hypothetical protein